ncbi:barstar family protein [Kitasatospora sp. NPDC057940]|uniref:barstar family protein n=1 Tax=Kitasatospora sp. NPDC057940 TaxID=3346285 RepID=UPI0036DD6388
MCGRRRPPPPGAQRTPPDQRRVVPRAGQSPVSFPACFGHHWDAFEERLTDTRHPPRRPDPAGLPILVSGAEAVLVDEPVRELTALLRILDTAATGEGPFLRVPSLGDDPGAVERRPCSGSSTRPPPARARSCGCRSSATTPAPWNDGRARRPGPRGRSAPDRTAVVRRGVPPAGGTPARGWVSPPPPPPAGRRPRRSRRASPAGRARRPR